MAREKKKRRAVTYKLPEDLLAQLERLADLNRRKYTTELEVAIESHLRKHRMWPDADPAGEPGVVPADRPPKKKS